MGRSGLLLVSPYFVFCPLWFSEKLISLRNKTGTANGDINMQTTMDYWRPVRARSIFHETYHWKTTVSDPRCLDYEYKALAVTNLAVSDQSKSTTNAESWAQAALAIHLQKMFHLSSPPLPEGYKGTTANFIEGADLVEIGLDSAPAGWNSPVLNTNQNYSPDMTNMVMLWSIGALTSGSGE
jgi:hypothetical protein